MSILLYEAEREINEQVNALHSSIIREFLDHLDTPEPVMCPDCLWPGKAAMFNSYLTRYTALKMEIQRARRGSRYLAEWVLGSNILQDITMTRHHLVDLAPCNVCIIKYNPTHRRRESPWNPKRAKAWKELLM
jgi:hypothetical protein